MAKPVDAIRLAAADATVTDNGASKAVEQATADPTSSCTRKVKVVYAGYGEAERAGCVASAAPAN